MRVTLSGNGGFPETEKFLRKAAKPLPYSFLTKYGKMGVEALQKATPVDTGTTAASWYYTITQTDTGIELNFCNSNRNNGVPIAIILQLGHATGTGGYVSGRDYINPAIQPLFESMAQELWKGVTK